MIEIAAAVALAVLAAFGVGRMTGRRAKSKEVAADAARKSAQAHSTRRSIEDDIQQDADIYRRAVNSGIVHQPGQ